MGENSLVVNSISTRFTDRYGIRHPFAAAGLAFAGMTPDLPIAVCRAGGLGAFGVGPLPPEAVSHAIHAIRQGTSAPFNINFITIFVTEAHIALCEELKPPVVSFHWGHPSREWIDRLHKAGCDVWEQVGSAAAARLAVDDGVDAVIAQGSESGGHNYGELPTFVLVPDVIRAAGSALVLAAGGIVDGRGVAAALSLGADAVWVGSRLVATTESSAAMAYKQQLVASASNDAVLASLWGRDLPVHFNPMRVLRNRIVAEWETREDEVPEDLSTQPVVGSMEMMGQTMPVHRFMNVVPMQGFEGDLDSMPLLAGQGLGGISSIEPAGTIVEAMMAEATAQLKQLAGRCA